MELPLPAARTRRLIPAARRPRRRRRVPGTPADAGAAGAATAQNNAAKNGFDAYGNPVAPPGQKKSFLLDPVLQ